MDDFWWGFELRVHRRIDKNQWTLPRQRRRRLHRIILVNEIFRRFRAQQSMTYNADTWLTESNFSIRMPYDERNKFGKSHFADEFTHALHVNNVEHQYMWLRNTSIPPRPERKFVFILCFPRDRIILK